MRRIHAVFLHCADDFRLIELGDLFNLGKAGLELVQNGLAELKHLVAHAERGHIGLGISGLRRVVRRRERQAVEHVAGLVLLLVGDDGAGVRMVDQLVGQCAGVADSGGQRRGGGVLDRLDHAHDLQLLRRVEALCDGVRVVADVRVVAVRVLHVLV